MIQSYTITSCDAAKYVSVGTEVHFSLIHSQRGAFNAAHPRGIVESQSIILQMKLKPFEAEEIKAQQYMKPAPCLSLIKGY